MVLYNTFIIDANIISFQNMFWKYKMTASMYEEDRKAATEGRDKGYTVCLYVCLGCSGGWVRMGGL